MNILSRIRRISIIGIFLLCPNCLYLAPIVSSETHTAASPSFADVSSAIAAAHSGDIVVVPAGTATWNEPLIITKGVFLRGAGIGSTVIISSYSKASDYLITYDPASPELNEPFRLSGFTIDCNNHCGAIRLRNMTTKAINKIRIDHNDIHDSPNRLIVIDGTVFGVIDNNMLNCDRYHITSYGSNEAAWENLTFEYGTADNIYIEDNTFVSNAGTHASGGGGRYCARYNTYTLNGPTYPWCDIHGNMLAGMFPSTMGAEIYENKIDSGSYLVGMYDHRGGKAIIFNNNVNISGSVGAQVREEYNDSEIPPEFSPDGQPQHISESYYWNNTKNNSIRVDPKIIQTINYGPPRGIVPSPNEEFWYQGDTFNGTSGVGVGPLSSRPTQCTVGVGYWATDTKTLYRATATNTWTAYYTPYAYPHPLRLPLNLTNPNGGETFALGSKRSISWTTSEYEGTISISLYRNGSKVLDIGTAQAIDHSYSWTIPNNLEAGGGYTVKIVGGNNQDISEAPFTLVVMPIIDLSRSSLNFGAVSGMNASSQTVFLRNAGLGNMTWTVSSSQPWLSCTPTSGENDSLVEVLVSSSSLAPGLYDAVISVSSADAMNSPVSIPVKLTVEAAGTTAGPFGIFDTPVDEASVYGSIAVTGWALDNIEVVRVELKRAPHVDDLAESIGADGLVYIGDANFVEGSRPDVEQLYSSYPLSNRAGWGYLMLTYGLPNLGNGTYDLYAFAYDIEGNRVRLGKKTIHSDNANSDRPFGAIDTPGQGGIVSGTEYVNFGWALTPQPKTIPNDGSTIFVWVDGVALGNAEYNNYRVDIATSFPGYANSNGAVGYFYINTLGLANGMHTIGWTVTDDAGKTDGIGSRFFTVMNIGNSTDASYVTPSNFSGLNSTNPNTLSFKPSLSLSETLNLPIRFRPLTIRRGYDLNSEPIFFVPDTYGTVHLKIRQVERLEIKLDVVGSKSSNDVYRDGVDIKRFSRGMNIWPRSSSWAGYVIVGQELRPLPIGSHLNIETGVFTWLLGPAFLGEYRFLFIENRASISVRIQLVVYVDSGGELKFDQE